MHRKNYHYCIILVILCASFILFQPKVSSFIFPIKRTILWNSFYQEIIKSKQLPLRSFWIFREFYYPGYFIFKPYRLSSPETNKILEQLGISVKEKAFFYPFLSYHSTKIQSLEALVTSYDLSKIITIKTNISNVVLKNKTTIIFYPEKKKVMIIFIRSLEEMKKINGFFNYKGIHKKIVENKLWLNITSIYLD